MKGLLILLVLAVSARAEVTLTNQVITTNVVYADESFRVVRGQLYNSAIAQGWRVVHGTCRAVLKDVIVVQEFEVKRTYEAVRSTPNRLGRIGAFGGGVPSSPRLVDERREYGKFVALTNCEDQIFVDDEVRGIALPVGSVRWNQKEVELLDRGVRHRTTVVVTNKMVNGRLSR